MNLIFFLGITIDVYTFVHTNRQKYCIELLVKQNLQFCETENGTFRNRKTEDLNTVLVTESNLWVGLVGRDRTGHTLKASEALHLLKTAILSEP